MSNTFHIVDGNKLARTFNDNHVLENHALFTGMELWREDEFNFFLNSRVSKTDLLDLRATVIKMVLATDMVEHFNSVGQFKTKLASKEKVKRMSTFSPNTSLGSLTKDEDALKHERFCEIKSQRDLQALVLCMAIKCADLGHCALPLAAHKKWVGALEMEFFAQGDAERDASMPVGPRTPGPTLRVDQVEGNGPARYCSPRHRMPCNSIHEGSPLRVNDVAGPGQCVVVPKP